MWAHPSFAIYPRNINTDKGASTAQAGQQSGISKVLDEKFDEAYNITKHENDIPDGKWGRIDYFDVTYLTTKWNIWQWV